MQMLAQNRTAVIKISCLATLGNNGSFQLMHSILRIHSSSQNTLASSLGISIARSIMFNIRTD